MQCEKNYIQLRKEGGRNGTKPRGETGTAEGVKMTAKEIFKAVRDSWARTRDIVIGGLTMGKPQSVESHCMTSLKTITIAATQEARTARRPRIKSLVKSNRLRKAEKGTEVGPDLLC